MIKVIQVVGKRRNDTVNVLIKIGADWMPHWIKYEINNFSSG